MKKLTHKLGGGLLVGLLATGPAMAAISLSVQPGSQSVGPGDTFTVDIVVTGRQGAGPGGADEIIRAYDLLLGYDVNLLTATGLTFSNNLSGGVAGGSLQDYTLNYNPATGGPPGPAIDTSTYTYTGTYPTAVEFAELSLLCYDASDTCLFPGGPYLNNIQAIPPDLLTLATITFQVSPTAPVNIATMLDLMDGGSYSPNNPQFDAKGIVNDLALQITLNDGVVGIPEPGSLALLLGGVSLLGARSVSRRKCAAMA